MKIRQLFKKINAEIQDMVAPNIIRRRETGKIGDEDDDWFINSLKSRLFFASQSQMNAILSLLQYAVKAGKLQINQRYADMLDMILCLEYMSYFTIKIVQKNYVKQGDQFRIELLLSAGVNLDRLETVQDHTAPLKPPVVLTMNLNVQEFNEIINLFQ